MKTKHLTVCPRCHEFYSTEADPSSVKCVECGAVLQLVDYSYDFYMALTAEEKTAFKQKYISEHFPDSVPYRKPFEPMPQSGWVTYIAFCGWLSLALCLIGCMAYFLSGGFLFAVVLGFVGALSCGSLILFSIIAADVRHIRNQVDKLHYDNKYNK